MRDAGGFYDTIYDIILCCDVKNGLVTPRGSDREKPSHNCGRGETKAAVSPCCATCRDVDAMSMR